MLGAGSILNDWICNPDKDKMQIFLTPYLNSIVCEVNDLQLLEIIPDAENVPLEGGEVVTSEDHHL